MRKLVLITSLIVFLGSTLCAQINDSTKVKKVFYDHNTNKKKMVLVSEQQMKAKPYYDKGYLLVGNHNFKQAIKPLKKAIEIDPSGNCGTGKDGVGFSELGYAYTRLGDFTNALVYLNKAIESNKNIPEPYLSKSVIYLQQKKYKQSIETLNTLISNIPNYAMGYVQRGFAYETIGEDQKALDDFNKFITLVTQQGQVQNSKALVDDIKKQIKQLEKKLN